MGSEARELARRLVELNCHPGPVSDPHECDLSDDVCECLRRAQAAALLRSLDTARTSLQARVAKLERERDRLRDELTGVSNAIATVRFLDPPDGGDVPLAVQVRRMRRTLDTAEASVKDLVDGLEGLPDLRHVINWLQAGCAVEPAIAELCLYETRVNAARALLAKHKDTPHG